MKYLLLSLFLSTSAMAQDFIDLKCHSKSAKNYIVDLRVGITETSIDRYEIDPNTTELMINSEDNLLQLASIKETSKGWKSFLLKFDAFNGVEIDYSRDYFVELIATDNGFEALMQINDEKWNYKDVLICDKELENLFGYIAI